MYLNYSKNGHGPFTENVKIINGKLKPFHDNIFDVSIIGLTESDFFLIEPIDIYNTHNRIQLSEEWITSNPTVTELEVTYRTKGDMVKAEMMNCRPEMIFENDKWYLKNIIGEKVPLNDFDGAKFIRNDVENACEIKFNDISRYWLKTANNGIYWNSENQSVELTGTDGKKVSFSLVNGCSEFGEIKENGISLTDKYLEKSSAAVDSLKLNGQNGSFYSPATHNHDGVYEPANSNIQSHISNNDIHITPEEKNDIAAVKTHADSAHAPVNAITSAGVTYENLNANGDVGTGLNQVAVGNHDHDSVYLGKSAKAADSDKLDGLHASSFSASNHNHDTVYLKKNGKAIDADKLDGLNSTSFIRSDADNSSTINFSDPSKYLLAIANNWGLYWNTTPNAFEFHGNGIKNASIDLDSGEITGNCFLVKDSNTKVDKGNQNSFKITTPSGNISIGAQNTSYMHFYTDRARYYFDKPVYIEGEIYSGSSSPKKVWHSGNDGSGSGLDADLLDGLQASNFALTGHNHDASYLGKTAKAADSDKLDGLDSTAFARTSHGTHVSTSTCVTSVNGQKGNVTVNSVSTVPAGNTSTGALAYNGNSAANGKLYGGTSAPTNTTRLNYDGYFYATKVFNAVYNDYAECFENAEGYTFKDLKNLIVEVDDEGKIRPASENSSRVVGVVSDSYATVLAGTEEEIKSGEKSPVGMSGTLWVKKAENSDYSIGNFIISSDNGFAKEINRNEVNNYPGLINGKIIKNENDRVKILIMNR